MNLLNDFSPGLFVMQAVILLILIVLMKKFAWKPILASLEDRETGIKNALDEAENARKELQNLKADNERILNEARQERDTMLQEAKQIKEKMITEAETEAKAKADQMIEKAQQNITAQKNAALTELKSQVADMSVTIAEKVVKGQLKDQQNQKVLIDSLLAEVKA